MIVIRKIALSEDSLVYKYLPTNYSDSIECAFISSKDIKPDDIQIAFWTTKPKWVEWLFKLRSVLVKPFGLKSEINKHLQDLKDCILEGKVHKTITIPSKSKEETVICNVDKHLTYYLSVRIIEKENFNKTLIVSTLINFHNFFGHCYFFVIYPFHTIIVKTMLKRIVRNIG